MGGTSSGRPSVVTLCGDVGYVGWCGGGFGDGGNFGGDDNCSGDSRYKPRHYHERNCDVTKKVLRTIFNSRHATEKLPRRLLGQPGF